MDLKELLKLAKTKTTKEYSEDNLSEVKQFCIFLDLKEGRSTVSAYFIYEMYIQWTTSTTPLSKISFFRRFHKYFHPVKRDRKNYYKLNNNSFEIHTVLKRKLSVTETKKE